MSPTNSITKNELDEEQSINLMKNNENLVNQKRLEDEQLISGMSKIKWPPKRKIDPKLRYMRRNARVQRLVKPKSPLVVFCELYKNVPIKLQTCQIMKSINYTATFEIDGQMYTGTHSSKTHAKQKACESYFRSMLADKIASIENKKETSMDIDIKGSEIGTIQKPQDPPIEEFPWPHFASLAMHSLINKWEIQSSSKPKYLKEESNVIQSQPKAEGIKVFPDNPQIYNPTQLLYLMNPDVTFTTTAICVTSPTLFQVKCKIDDIPFIGQGSSKKIAKKECCIAAIKYFWKFNFHDL